MRGGERGSAGERRQCRVVPKPSAERKGEREKKRERERERARRKRGKEMDGARRGTRAAAARDPPRRETTSERASGFRQPRALQKEVERGGCRGQGRTSDTSESGETRVGSKTTAKCIGAQRGGERSTARASASKAATARGPALQLTAVLEERIETKAEVMKESRKTMATLLASSPVVALPRLAPSPLRPCPPGRCTRRSQRRAGARPP